MSWDYTRLQIDVTGSVPSESQLWKLHERIWKVAFASLGERHKITLHSWDSNVTVHPTHPCMWFYPGPDLESRVSTDELVYAFPADELNNPVFTYVPVHHWFCLGLAMGHERIIEMARGLELELTLPGFDDVLGTSTFTFAFVSGKLHQLHEGLKLLSQDGWTDPSTLSDAQRESLARIWESKLCECPICPRVRRTARDHAWNTRLAALTKEHGDGAGLFDAMFDQPDFPAEAKAWRAEHGKKLIATDPDAVAVLERHILRGNAEATESLAAALRRKSALRARHLDALASSLQSERPQVLGTLLGVRLEKADFTPALLTALEAALPAVNFEPARTELVGVLSKRVDWTADAAKKRLAALLESDQANTRYAGALLIAYAFNAAKAAGKAKLLGLVDRALGCSEPRIVGAALHAELRKADFDSNRFELLTSLEGLEKDALLRLVERFSALDWKAPKHLEQQKAIAYRFFASPEPDVRKAAVKAFLPGWSSYREMKKKERAIFDELCRAASDTVHPEFVNELIRGYDGLSKDLRKKLLADLDLGVVIENRLARRAPAFPELQALYERMAVERMKRDGTLPSFGCSSGADAVSAAKLAATLIAESNEMSSIERITNAFERRAMVDVLVYGNMWMGSDGRPLAAPGHPDLACFIDALRAKSAELAEGHHVRALRALIAAERLDAAKWLVPVVPTEQIAFLVEALMDAWATAGSSQKSKDSGIAIVQHHPQTVLPAFRAWSTQVGVEHAYFVGMVLAWSAIMNTTQQLDASLEFLDVAFEMKPHPDFLYNKACALIRRPDPEASAAVLAESIQLLPENRDYAKKDADFGKYLDHPAFAPLLA